MHFFDILKSQGKWCKQWINGPKEDESIQIQYDFSVLGFWVAMQAD